MKNRRYEVLCFVDNYQGRDIEILMPLVVYIEAYLNCSVRFVLYYDTHSINRYKPDVVLIASIYGSLIQYNITKYAVDQNIKVFSLFSEGRIVCHPDTNYFGNNPIRKFFQEYVCCWSIEIRDFLRAQHPDIQNKIVCTGATGFDSYRFFSYPTREEILKKYNKKNFKKVIGYAGWGFAKLVNPVRKLELLKAINHDQKVFQEITDHRDHVENTLRSLIENNPDTLFILKKHPQETMPIHSQDERNEMSRLSEYDNVIYIKSTESVKSVLSICDLWLCYDSTTATEAWLLKPDMPTFFIQKNKVPVYNSGLIAGGIQITRYEQIQKYINIFYSTGNVKDFFDEERLNFRNSKLENSYGYTDGMNHIRTGFYFEKMLKKIEKDKPEFRPLFSLKYTLMWLAMSLGKYFYNRKVFAMLPKFKKTIWIFERNKMWLLEDYKKQYALFMKKFYEKNNLDERIKNRALFNEIIDTGNESI
jgi:hypothetical protein